MSATTTANMTDNDTEKLSTENNKRPRDTQSSTLSDSNVSTLPSDTCTEKSAKAPRLTFGKSSGSNLWQIGSSTQGKTTKPFWETTNSSEASTTSTTTKANCTVSNEDNSEKGDSHATDIKTTDTNQNNTSNLNWLSSFKSSSQSGDKSWIPAGPKFYGIKPKTSKSLGFGFSSAGSSLFDDLSAARKAAAEAVGTGTNKPTTDAQISIATTTTSSSDSSSDVNSTTTKTTVNSSSITAATSSSASASVSSVESTQESTALDTSTLVASTSTSGLINSIVASSTEHSQPEQTSSSTGSDSSSWFAPTATGKLGFGLIPPPTTKDSTDSPSNDTATSSAIDDETRKRGQSILQLFQSTPTTVSSFTNVTNSTSTSEGVQNKTTETTSLTASAPNESLEDVTFRARGKLYRLHPQQNQWHEAGIGPLRIWVTHPEDDSKTRSARISMHQETHPEGPGIRLLLNLAVWKDMQYEIHADSAKIIRISGIDASGINMWSIDETTDAASNSSTLQKSSTTVEPFLVKFSNQNDAKRFKDMISLEVKGLRANE